MSEEKRKARRKLRPATLVTQAGRSPFDHFGFVNPPIYRGSTVLFPTVAALEALRQPYTYGTKGTPTTRALEQGWSEIAGAADTVLTPSGLAAIGLALLTATHAGAHALIVDSAYQPTRIFCDGILARFGVNVDYYDPLIGGGIAAMMKPETTAVLVESPGSQSMEVQDIPAIAAAAHAHGACVIADNTWATPLFFPPHERGCDLAVEAGTKYLAGHADLLMGLVSANSKWAKRLRATFNAFSMGSSPDDAALALARSAHHGATAARTGARGARHRAVAGGPTGSFARAASWPCVASRPRVMETRFYRCLWRFFRYPQRDFKKGGRRFCRRIGIVRYRILVGRL